MSFFTESSSHTWQPTITSDSTTLSYWLNWRFFFCALWILASMALASFLIFKYEGFNKSRSNSGENQGEEEAGLLYEDEAWNTCLKGIDPSWLLIYRIICFVVLLALIIASVAADGAGIFYFYTQWTFTLVTIYFGFGSYFSLYGCSLKQNKYGSSTVNGTSLDPELGTYIVDARKTAGLWGYIFQIIFQTCAGAVVLTDSVFWFILYPFLMSKDYSVDFLIFCMHSINALFLLGDTSLNCMRFPMFRFAYFVLWTSTFVIFQWIIHVALSFP
uniref:Transmembrane protein n=1 Tax=Glycine max TaxID=3847 RepID=A0A0R0IYY1_SOYBN